MVNMLLWMLWAIIFDHQAKQSSRAESSPSLAQEVVLFVEGVQWPVCLVRPCGCRVARHDTSIAGIVRGVSSGPLAGALLIRASDLTAKLGVNEWIAHGLVGEALALQAQQSADARGKGQKVYDDSTIVRESPEIVAAILRVEALIAAARARASSSSIASNSFTPVPATFKL